MYLQLESSFSSFSHKMCRCGYVIKVGSKYRYILNSFLTLRVPSTGIFEQFFETLKLGKQPFS
jgi:hypothetical protein